MPDVSWIELGGYFGAVVFLTVFFAKAQRESQSQHIESIEKLQEAWIADAKEWRRSYEENTKVLADVNVNYGRVLSVTERMERFLERFGVEPRRERGE